MLVHGALCVRPRRSLCRGPALCVGPQRSPCQASVGARRSLCRGLALPGAFCPGLSGPGGRPLTTLSVSGPGALCFGARPAVSVSAAGTLAVSVSGPGALRIEAQHSSVCRWSSPNVLCVGPALSVGVRLSLCRAAGPSPQLRSACSYACYPSAGL